MIRSFIGAVNQGCHIIGWIPNKLVISVDTNEKYIMKFTIQTYDVSNKLCLIDCICDGEIAKAIYDQYRKYDVIMIWGQLHHTYVPTSNYKRTTIRVKVLDFTLPIAFKIGMNEPQLDEETTSMISYVQNEAFEYYNKKKSTPTKEEIKYWVDRWAEWRKQNGIK
jgi:outer membrane phospholipase A